jgi:PPOX class probable F420-dependent enzyme
MSLVRRLENRFYGSVRHPAAAEVAARGATEWRPADLNGHKYCLLTSYRASGAPVTVPVWFGTEGERIYIRSGPEDGKVKRIRRNSQVLITPCTARGRPVGPPMSATGRILEPPEHGHAEAVLRSSYGLGRRIYRLLGRGTRAAYVAVSGPAAGTPS